MAAMRKGYVDTQDGQLHYWRAGTGPALVCLHQASQDCTEYRALIPALATHHTLVAFDLPGHGQSFDPPRDYDVPDYVNALMEAVRSLGLGPVAVLGHHSGAVFALEMAARFPAIVGKVILSGLSWRSAENTQALIEARAERNLPVTADGRFLSTMWSTYASLVGEGVPVDGVLEPYLVNQLMRLRPTDAHHAVLAWDKSAALKSVQCPVLLLQGERDVFVVGQDTLMTQMPTAKRQVIPGAGAFTFRDRPTESARMIQEFLAQ
jgi:pimeloyl-ACP methyl ester carboxylesterase